MSPAALLSTCALAAVLGAGLAQAQPVRKQDAPPLATDRPAARISKQASSAPQTVLLGCIGDSADGHPRWGGSMIEVRFDGGGRAAVTLTPRVDYDFRISLCYDGRYFSDMRIEAPPGASAAQIGTQNRFWIEVGELPGERGTQRRTLRITATRPPQSPAEVAVPFTGQLDITINYVNVPQMEIVSIQREDYRPNRQGTLSNQGVLDPRLLQGPDQSAGRFTLLGRQLLGNDPVQVLVGGTAATIEQRSSAGDTDRLVVVAPTLGSGTQIEVRRGEFAARPLQLVRRAYRTFGPQDLTDITAGTQIELGRPRGSGRIAAAGTVTTVTVDPVINEKGLTLHLEDLRSRSAKLFFSDHGEAQALMKIELEFEDGGDELVGTLLEQIDVYRCGGFTIERSRCATLDGACLRQVLGSALASAGNCAQASAWGAQRINGPARKVVGQIADARVTIWVKLAAHGNGWQTLGGLNRVEFAGRVSAKVDGAALPMSAETIQSRIQSEVGKRLFDQLAAQDVAQKIADGIHRGAVINIARPRVHGYYALRNGAGVFVDLSSP